MSRVDNSDFFFQTSNSIAERQRREEKSKNKHGSPVDVGAKILAVLANEKHGIFMACGDGLVRKVDLDKNKVITKYTGANAPLACLAISIDSVTSEAVLFAGCWDKTIHSWSLTTSSPIRRYSGHSDFIKCIATTTVSSQDLLISGSADANIILWSIKSGHKLYTLKGHARGVLSLALDLSPIRGSESFDLFSADSVREIRKWSLSCSSSGIITQISSEVLKTVHETSVNKLVFEHASGTSDENDEEAESDLWTASSDNTVKRLTRSRGWEVDTTLTHPDFVRDVNLSSDGRYVITACRDENVRVWDSSSGEIMAVFEGHFDDVTGLAIIYDSNVRRDAIISVSLDGTVRKWQIDDSEMQKTLLKKDKKEVQESNVVSNETAKTGMTAEEEAELAELMDE